MTKPTLIQKSGSRASCSRLGRTPSSMAISATLASKPAPRVAAARQCVPGGGAAATSGPLASMAIKSSVFMMQSLHCLFLNGPPVPSSRDARPL